MFINCYTFTLNPSESFDTPPNNLFPPLHAGMGADPSRPPCRKAKELRKERRLQKDQIRQEADGVSAPKPNPNQPKSLEEFINESLGDNASHQFEVNLNKTYFFVTWSNNVCGFKQSFGLVFSLQLCLSSYLRVVFHSYSDFTMSSNTLTKAVEENHMFLVWIQPSVRHTT